ncbi:ABC transporter permease [Parasphingorhabdus pacifica]
MSIDNSTNARNQQAEAASPGAGGFGAALRYEWTNLRTLRSPWVLSGLAVLLQLVYTLLDDREGSTGFRQFSSGLQLLTLITFALVAAIGVNAFGSEYRYRTITTTTLVTRSPARIVLAKAAAVGGIATMTALLVIAVDYLGVLLLGGAALDPARAAVAGFGAIVYLVLSALIGLALAGLTRSAVAALGAIILWPGVLETTLVGAADVAPDSMPFLSARQLAVTSDPQWYLPLLLAGLTTVLLAGTVAALSWRDA